MMDTDIVIANQPIVIDNVNENKLKFCSDIMLFSNMKTPQTCAGTNYVQKLFPANSAPGTSCKSIVKKISKERLNKLEKSLLIIF